MVKPGYDASASSTAGPVNPLPTFSGVGSMTVHRSRVEAPSSVSASGAGIATRDQATSVAVRDGVSWLRTHSAFSSTSRPVSTNSTWLRKPPSSLTQTLSRSGGASPWTPVTATRSVPSCSSLIEPRSTVTSGLR